MTNGRMTNGRMTNGTGRRLSPHGPSKPMSSQSAVIPTRRRPVWSGALTTPLAARIPDDRRGIAIVAIKAFHSAAFFSIAGLILLFTWDGLRGRPGRRTAIAATVAVAESAVFASNNQVCPLTPLVEELGAESGSVTDIFLPDWLSRRIPPIFGGLLLVGLVLHGRTWLARRRAR